MISQNNIISSILKAPLKKGRRFVAIVGPPASGKSTLAKELQRQIPSSCVVPMDGFHLSNEELKVLGLSERKGSAETFDVDGLDSSIMPATGTPEPGGLLWDETLNIIRIAAKNSKIVGADINELSPIKGFNSYNFLVAKLAYKILSYKFLY